MIKHLHNGWLLLWLLACASPPEDTEYFPTHPGYEWRYDLSRLIPNVPEPLSQKAIVRSLTVETIDNTPHYPLLYANGKKYFLIKSDDGLIRKRPGEDTGEIVLGKPLAVGTRWTSPSALFVFNLPQKPGGNRDGLDGDLSLEHTITSLNETVNVPAGSFHHCMRVDARGFMDLPKRLMLGIKTIKVEQTKWYAPGVGLIKQTRKEYALPHLYPGELTQVLTAYKPI